jgi:PhoH-like ATPase
MKKNYVIDTNVLIDNPECIDILRNGEENNVFLSIDVIHELDSLKKNERLRHLINAAINNINRNLDYITIIGEIDFQKKNDLKILKQIKDSKEIDNPILVTNDEIFKLYSKITDVNCENFKSSNPFKSESQIYTGFIKDLEKEFVPNCFIWENGFPVFYNKNKEPKIINYNNIVWNVAPRNVYQNLALELMLNDDINLVTIQSEAGMGKTYLSLATALLKVLQSKTYSKIFVVKPIIEIGEKLGYLPGTLEEKLDPYMKYLFNLLLKLHEARNAGKIFINTDNANKIRFDSRKFEILPLGYIRGMNIDDAFVIIDEAQNITRQQMRSILTRMGENVKCVCIGDVKQIDHPHLNEQNNGLNWCVVKLKGFDNYSHMTLKNKNSRGPICDMVLKSNL